MDTFNIPNEILLLIGECLEYESDLNALCTVNRRFFELFNPILYKRLTEHVHSDVGSTALEWAAENNKTDCMRKIFDAGVPPDMAFVESCWAPIILAVRAGHLDTVKLLIERGVDPNPVYGFYKDDLDPFTLRTSWDPEHAWNPLLEAVFRGQTAIVELLVSHGVDLEFDSELFQVDQPLILATSGCHLPIIRLLLENGCSPYLFNPAMANTIEEVRPNAIRAAASSTLEILKIFLEAGADPRLNVGYGSSTLTCAINGGNLAIVKFLLDWGIDPDAPTELGLHRAFFYASHTNRDISALFLTRIDTHRTINYGTHSNFRFLLEGAGAGGWEDLIERILDRGRGPDGAGEGFWIDSLQSAFDYAVQHNRLRIVEMLLDHGARPDGLDFSEPYSTTTAIRKGNSEILALLLDRGANIDYVAWDEPYLQTAISTGNVDLVKVLLEKKYQSKFATISNLSKMMITAVKGGEAVFKLLLEQGVSLDPQNKTHHQAFITAAKQAKLTALKAFLDAGFSPEIRDTIEGNGHQSLLCLALVAIDAEAALSAAELLLNYGADIEARDPLTDETPLLYMVGRKGSPINYQARLRATRILLEKGANPFFINNRDQNPLTKAAEKGNLEMVKLLLEFFDTKEISLEIVKPLIRKGVSFEHWRVAKTIWNWYCRRLYPSP
ncbi:hypothetical protein N7462_001428 [Penicillium macrosclerotiorum]|uniref:uncharacterized protein n=1 Tax=Penicillium macrosclerotiorum TaxID=303699 RepID=UPI0025470266|nr:uncharacterized protein N7462_001428 [Penicillium macrosclerotiorum]KAJ5692005.1 hypothetical protein N7462_001428 [Penicillium macrosclerotiorum]